MVTKEGSDNLKKITISLPEELYEGLKEEATKNGFPFDELILRKLNKVFSSINEFSDGFLTNKIKNSRIDYLEKERERLLKQMYEGRLYTNEQFQLECIERELKEFIPKTEEEKRIDELFEAGFNEIFSKPLRTKEEILKDLKELNKKSNNEKK